jgi:hypothetical protein
VTADLLPKLFDDIACGAIELDEAVTQLADADRAADVATLVAARARLDPSIAARALESAAQETVAMLCRAAGLGVNGYAALLRMRRRHGRPLDGSFSALAAAYVNRPRPTPRQVTEALVAPKEDAAEPV